MHTLVGLWEVSAGSLQAGLGAVTALRNRCSRAARPSITPSQFQRGINRMTSGSLQLLVAPMTLVVGGFRLIDHAMHSNEVPGNAHPPARPESPLLPVA